MKTWNVKKSKKTEKVKSFSACYVQRTCFRGEMSEHCSDPNVHKKFFLLTRIFCGVIDFLKKSHLVQKKMLITKLIYKYYYNVKIFIIFCINFILNFSHHNLFFLHSFLCVVTDKKKKKIPPFSFLPKRCSSQKPIERSFTKH